jgi:hypothetical protein
MQRSLKDRQYHPILNKITLFINPKYAPSMVVGRWIVNNQTPEYVGAPQKMWAWGFGFFLAALMFYLVVLNDIRGPVNILTVSIIIFIFYPVIKR